MSADSFDRMCAYMGPSPTRSRFAEPEGGWAASEDERSAMYDRIAVQVTRPPWAMLHRRLNVVDPRASRPELAVWFAGVTSTALSCTHRGEDEDLCLPDRVIRVAARTAGDWRKLNELVDAVLGPTEVGS